MRKVIDANQSNVFSQISTYLYCYIAQQLMLNSQCKWGVSVFNLCSLRSLLLNAVDVDARNTCSIDKQCSFSTQFYLNQSSLMNHKSTIVIIGGGIAGTSCIEALIDSFDPSNPLYSQIILISASRILKRATNYVRTGRLLETFDVVEESADHLKSRLPEELELKLVEATVKSINTKRKEIYYYSDSNSRESPSSLSYDVVCICTGSYPRPLSLNRESRIDERIIVVRDTSTVCELQERLKSCRKLVIVGNGGIGLELVSKVSNCKKSWIIKDDSIGLTFFDSGAAKFLLDSIGNENFKSKQGTTSDSKYTVKQGATAKLGPSLGPDWSSDFLLKGDCQTSDLNVIYRDEVCDIIYTEEEEYPLSVVTTSTKQVLKCDLVISAIGVIPNLVEIDKDTLDTSRKDCGILVDCEMRTSISTIYAAGDVISCDRWAQDELWFQMRLWTQARQMGFYAGKCIDAHLKGSDPSIYFNFECFTHSTSFFGQRVILLGRYNGQGTEDQKFEVIARVKPGKDYVKILVNDAGRIIGAVLVGDSGLEETIENLIYDRIDISAYKNELLDETVDIEDFFD